MTLLRWLTFLLGYQTVVLTVLFIQIYLFLLTFVVMYWLALIWEILIILLQFPLIFRQTQNRMPCFITQLMTILVLIGMVFVIIWEMLHERMSVNSVLLLLLVNFVSGFRLELMYTSLIVGIRWNFTRFHGFQQLVLLS